MQQIYIAITNHLREIRNRSNTISLHLISQNIPRPHNFIYYTTFAVLLLNLCSSDAYPSVLKSDNYFNNIQEYNTAFSKKTSKNTNTNHGIPDIFNVYDDQQLDQWYNIQRIPSNTIRLQNDKVGNFNINILIPQILYHQSYFLISVIISFSTISGSVSYECLSFPWEVSYCNQWWVEIFFYNFLYIGI